VIHFFWDRILGTYKGPDVSKKTPVGTIAVRTGKSRLDRVVGRPNVQQLP
jgi:sterol desaturase/sphingolipid hydroxylase (fatty acid hydroxylase superfamily)